MTENLRREKAGEGERRGGDGVIGERERRRDGGVGEGLVEVRREAAKLPRPDKLDPFVPAPLPP